MSRMEREKGARVEREIVTRHKAIGVLAERVPMSGASAYTHDADIDVYPFGRDAGVLIGEVKARAKLPKTTLDWLGENDLLFMKQNRQEPVVMMPWRVYERFLNGGRAR